MELGRIILLVTLLLCASSVRAQPSVSYAPTGDASADFETEVLLSGLDNPAGLALRPTLAKKGPYELFVAESGAGRVMRVKTNALEQVEEVITNFSSATVGEQPQYRVGPMGLAFISRNKLVVSAKGDHAGADFLAGYALPEPGVVLSAVEPDHTVGPLKSKLASQVDSLSFWSLVQADQTLYLTSGGSGAAGLILKSVIKANRLEYFQPFIDTQQVAGLGAPAGIVVTPRPRPAFLVAGLMGSRDTPNDSWLAFFVPRTGDLALNLPTGLHDIISLAYSPTGQLYAADFSWQDEQAGGVYRIDDARLEGQQTCRAVKIASLIRPVSLAFAPDGSLFVTAFGTGENTKQGTLVKITGEL